MAFTYMTGWRVSEPLALRREDLDLDAGAAITRHMFPWPHGRKGLWDDFTRIQEAAGIHLDCHEKHEHTRSCHVYGFHDLRRAFATMNAETLSADALQALMRHKSYLTTRRYINMTRQLRRVAADLHVPDVLHQATGG